MVHTPVLVMIPAKKVRTYMFFRNNETNNKNKIAKYVDYILSPYDQQLEVPFYNDEEYPIKVVQEQYDEIKALCEDADTKRNRWLEHYYSGIDEHGKKVKTIHEMTLGEFAQSYYEKELNETHLLSNYNPKGKWDWYEIGGRWGDLLPHKEDYGVTFIQVKDLKGDCPPFCVFVDRKGNWNESPEDWCSGDSEFAKEFHSKFIAPLPANDWLVIVDCHG